MENDPGGNELIQYKQPGPLLVIPICYKGGRPSQDEALGLKVTAD